MASRLVADRHWSVAVFSINFRSLLFTHISLLGIEISRGSVLNEYIPRSLQSLIVCAKRTRNTVVIITWSTRFSIVVASTKCRLRSGVFKILERRQEFSAELEALLSTAPTVGATPSPENFSIFWMKMACSDALWTPRPCTVPVNFS